MADKANIYQATRVQTAERFSERIDACAQGLVLVLSERTLGERARDALAKSFQALGYRAEDCTFAQVGGLEPKEAFELAEGIDPLCLVAADAGAAALYARAVRQEFPLMQPVRVFGREARGFPQLDGQLETEADRQAVWRLLKTLPRGD